MLEPIFLNIVTVVREDSTGLLRTCDSIASQVESRWAQTIVLSSAEDKSAENIPLKGSPNIEVLSQEGVGIYRAMNQGLFGRESKYVMFLNAGDSLSSPLSLSIVFEVLKASSPDWAVFGGVVQGESSSRILTPVGQPSIRTVGLGRANFMHPSIVYRRRFLEHVGGYREDYEIAGDLDLNLRCISISTPKLDERPIVTFVLGGISTTRLTQAILESHKARRRNWPRRFYLLSLIWMILQLARHATRRLLSPGGNSRRSNENPSDLA